MNKNTTRKKHASPRPKNRGVVSSQTPYWALKTVNIDPVIRSPRKTKQSKWVKTKNWFVGPRGVLRRDLFSVFKKNKLGGRKLK